MIKKHKLELAIILISLFFLSVTVVTEIMHHRFEHEVIKYEVEHVTVDEQDTKEFIVESIKLEETEEPNYSDVIEEATNESENRKTVKLVHKYYDVPLSEDTQDYVFERCRKYGIEPALVYAVIRTESNFEKDAYGGGNYGLMQINEICFDEYGLRDPFSEKENIRVGIDILGSYYQKYKSEEKALMAYNMGAGGASKLWDKGIYETSYVEKVKEAKNQITERR